MSDDLPEPERWCDMPAQVATTEEALGAVLRRVRAATEPSDAAVARLALRIDAEARSTHRRLLWRLVAAAALIMATGGAVGAALHRWRRAGVAAGGREAMVAPAPRSDEAHPSRRGGRAATAAGPAAPAAAEPPAAPAPSVAPADLAPAPSAPSRVTPGSAATARDRPSARLARSVPSSEASVLDSAFRQLRASGDASAAMRSLDEYDRRFPDGALRSEARVARAEALLMLDRRAEALRWLEELDGDGNPLTRDVLISRGELRAEDGRCPDALRDFDAVLVARASDLPGGRALYGRASCHLRAGDFPAARRDLTRYLSLHPSGPFAAAARRALESLP